MRIFEKGRLVGSIGLAVISFVLFAGICGTAEAETANEVCFGCHGSESTKLFVDQAVFQTSVHGALGCTTCHPNMASFPHQGKGSEAQQMCGTCHGDIGKEYSSSVHGKLFAQGNQKLSCTGCHGESHSIVPRSDSKSPVTHLNVVKTCSRCHEGEVVESYLNSFHGIANQFGSETTAQCVTCHGSHGILGPDDPASPVAKGNIATGCAKCHGGAALANFSEGPEHFTEEPGSPGAPMYWTLKFFIWLTIVVVTLLIIHMELELFRRLRKTKS